LRFFWLLPPEEREVLSDRERCRASFEAGRQSEKKEEEKRK
jgi:hypothetical protein